MAYDQTTFIDRLAEWMATAAGLQYTGTPRALWAGLAIEGAASADPYSVLAPYPGGETPFVPLTTLPLQVMTIGKGQEATQRQADLLYGALLDANGRPTVNVALMGFRLVAVQNLRPPGVVGRDADKRLRVAFNFDADFLAT